MIVHRRRQAARRAGFTLVELMISIMIIAMLATFILVALAGVTDKARGDRTKTQIAKIHELITEKWETYLYRRMPPASTQVVNFKRTGGSLTTNMLSLDRLNALRETMRIELPSHRADVLDNVTMLRDSITGQKLTGQFIPSLMRAYRNRALVATGSSNASELMTNWTTQNEGAECLYLILSQMREADSSALEFFAENEIGDVDGDGMKEIHDAWGAPIEWLRWAPGHASPLQVRLADELEQDDMFDPMKIGSSYASSFDKNFPRALYPLIYSAGPDSEYGVVARSPSGASWAQSGNNPYDQDAKRRLHCIGYFPQGHNSMMNEACGFTDAEVAAMEAKNADNITNHLLTTR